MYSKRWLPGRGFPFILPCVLSIPFPYHALKKPLPLPQWYYLQQPMQRKEMLKTDLITPISRMKNTSHSRCSQKAMLLQEEGILSRSENGWFKIVVLWFLITIKNLYLILQQQLGFYCWEHNQCCWEAWTFNEWILTASSWCLKKIQSTVALRMDESMHLVSSSKWRKIFISSWHKSLAKLVGGGGWSTSSPTPLSLMENSWNPCKNVPISKAFHSGKQPNSKEICKAPKAVLCPSAKEIFLFSSVWKYFATEHEWCTCF